MDLTERPITRDDVARAAGVSPATVSYVINNGPRPVAPETRKKVQAAIRDLGYQPNAVARNLRLQRTSTIGLILPDTHNPYFAEVARGVEQVAFEQGYTVMLCHSDYNPEREIQYVNVLFAERAAGVIWFPSVNSSEPAQRLSSFGIPLVVLDRFVPGLQCPTVVANNFRGGYMATQHLIDLGHESIACISRPNELYHSQERVRGYLTALQDHHLVSSKELVVKGGFRMEDGRAATFNLLNLKHPPTAIFAYNDFMAIGALRAASERGLRVPEDLSIVGFDDISQSAFTVPALTTIRQPKLDMGRRGTELLINLIDCKSPPTEAEAPLDVELIIRESTASPH